MISTESIISLKAGSLNASEVELYKVPANTKVEFTSLALFNKDNVEHTYEIKMIIESIKVTIAAGLLLPKESAEIFDDGFPKVLKAGEKLLGLANISNVVDFALFGQKTSL